MSQKKKIVIQGYKGSFHDEACHKYFNGEALEILPSESFHKLAKLLATDPNIHFGIMAIENSIAGSILQNYKLLRENNFWISGEVYLRISHHLMALKGQKISDIKEVHSHPMALYQCLLFLDQHPDIIHIESVDTALSAAKISQNKSLHIAAIASKLAAEIYDLEILAEGIESSEINYTRFAIIDRKKVSAHIAADKASIYLKVKHEKGALLKVLECIASNDISLSKLQSFPVLGQMSTYYFHLDLEFNKIEDYSQCMSDLIKVTTQLEELGVYKKATIYDYQTIDQISRD